MVHCCITIFISLVVIVFAASFPMAVVLLCLWHPVCIVGVLCVLFVQWVALLCSYYCRGRAVLLLVLVVLWFFMILLSDLVSHVARAALVLVLVVSWCAVISFLWVDFMCCHHARHLVVLFRVVLCGSCCEFVCGDLLLILRGVRVLLMVFSVPMFVLFFAICRYG